MNAGAGMIKKSKKVALGYRHAKYLCYRSATGKTILREVTRAIDP